MNIFILGAGRVGKSVAESLVSEKSDITVIDTDAQRLRALQERLDLRGVAGNGIQPSVLEVAGARDAYMLIACASADETNLVACKVAHEVLRINTRIARVRSPEFKRGSKLMATEGFAVDEVFVLAATQDIRRVLNALRRRDQPVRRVMIAGGGRGGPRLARRCSASAASS